jgi:hypothetical protein
VRTLTKIEQQEGATDEKLTDLSASELQAHA